MLSHPIHLTDGSNDNLARMTLLVNDPHSYHHPKNHPGL